MNIRDEIILACRNQPAIIAAYIFGSRASGQAKPDSDVDVAILLDRQGEKQFDTLAFMTALERICSHKFDLVVLNRAGELLQHQVRKNGQLIYDKAPEARKRFEIRGRKRYEDFLHMHRRHVGKVIYGEKRG